LCFVCFIFLKITLHLCTVTEKNAFFNVFQASKFRFVTRFIFTFLMKNMRNLSFLTLFCFFSTFLNAQKLGLISEKSVSNLTLPTVTHFPNPANVGDEMTIQLHFENTEINENSTFLMRISDETGRLVVESELPDELEFAISAEKFGSGLYFMQYFENGHLFETDELWIK
jgi:hypothetical protein